MSARRVRSEHGLSLITIVMSVVILGFLAALTVKMIDGTTKGDDTQRRLLDEIASGTTASTKITGTTVATNATTTSLPQAPGPGGIFASAARNECQVDARTVQTALEAYFAQNGQYPADLNALVSGGFLSSVPARPGYTFTLGPNDLGQPNGRVLVNGLPNTEGC